MKPANNISQQKGDQPVPFFNAIIDSPIGPLGIRTNDTAITHIEFLTPGTATKAADNTLAVQASEQLQQFFANPDFKFTLPIETTGTPFQTKVWQALQAIPKGTTVTYGELATTLNSSPRAIGNACRNNPTPVIVPCHRVVGKQGLGGFAGKTTGFTIETKQWLLQHES